MTVRRFDGVDDRIFFAPGNAAPIDGGPITIATIWRPSSNHQGGLIDGRNAGVRRWAINPFSDNNVYINTGGGITSTNYGAYIGQWALLAFTKPNGSSTVRTHLFRYDTSIWTHTDLAACGDSPGGIDEIIVGWFGSSEYLHADLAVMGIWSSALSDVALEGLTNALEDWDAASPAALWAFNQENVATPVEDITDGGADQTAITGTTVLSGQDPPGFDFSLPLEGVLAATEPADTATLTGDALDDGVLTGTAAAATGTFTGDQPDPTNSYGFISQLSATLLNCLCTAVATNPGAPQHCCYRVGTEPVHDIHLETQVDLCCEGLAYVLLRDVYPSTESFPENDIVRQAQAKCTPPTWAVAFRVGIVRCVPVVPDCDENNLAFVQNVYDVQSINEAMCCFRDFFRDSTVFLGMSLVIERQTQGSTSGGCTERYVNIVAQIPNLDCGCG